MFKFRLQRVLDLREQREQAVATRLAEARTGEDQARRACSELEGLRDQGVERAVRSQGAQPTVGQLQNLSYMVDRLNDQIEQAYQDAQVATRNVQRCMEEFTTAFQERRVLDRLRERDQEDWRAEEAHQDRQLMDGIALTGFLRTRKDAAATGEGE